MEYYDYTVLNLTAFGDYLDLEIRHPSNDNRSDGNKHFRALYTPPSTITFYLNEVEWTNLGKSENILSLLLSREYGLMSHEVTHFLNNTRFTNLKDGGGISKYEKRDTGEGSFGYVNSTEEVQARIMNTIFFITNELIEKDDDKNLYDFYHQKWLPIYENNTGTRIEIFLAKLLYYVVNNDLNSFVNHILSSSTTLYIGNDLLLEKTKKRYMKRLYDLFVTLKNKLENKQTSDYDDLPEYIEL